jgi:hypothetical protein
VRYLRRPIRLRVEKRGRGFKLICLFFVLNAPSEGGTHRHAAELRSTATTWVAGSQLDDCGGGGTASGSSTCS